MVPRCPIVACLEGSCVRLGKQVPHVPCCKYIQLNDMKGSETPCLVGANINHVQVKVQRFQISEVRRIIESDEQTTSNRKFLPALATELQVLLN